MSNTIWKVVCDLTFKTRTKAIGVYDIKKDIDTIKATLKIRLFWLENTDDRLS